jgi:hypothetical protein
MNQLILLHDMNGHEMSINIDVIGSCERHGNATFVFRKDGPRTNAWKVRETPSEIVAMQWMARLNTPAESEVRSE